MRAYWSGSPGAPAGPRARELAKRPWCGPPPGHPDAGTAAPPAPGEVVLLTYNQGSGHGAAWMIGTRHADPSLDRATLIGAALKALSDAHAVATQLLPMVLPPPARDVATTASPLRDPDGQPVIDGASVGLPLLLASLSARLDAPVPATLAATGALAEDGRIQDVGGLQAKIEAVYQGCPAVTRLVVPAAQLDEARAISGRWNEDPRFEIVGVESIEEAARLVWPDLEAICRARLSSDVAAATRALSIYVRRRGGTSWRSAANTAAFLRQRPGADTAALTILEKIARRHTGERDVLLPWPDRAQCSHLEVWFPDAAHAVQSAGDSGSHEELREYLRLAERELRPLGERSPGELELVGSIGRGWAVLYEAGRAEAHLREATEAWHLIGQPVASSFALCEWIRVVGAFGLQNADQVIDQADRWLAEVAFPAVSRAYIQLELARARLALAHPRDLALRDADAVLAWVARPDGNPARSPGPTARRLRIRALRRLGMVEQADAELQALVALREAAPKTGPGAADSSLYAAIELARLDRLLDEGGDLDGTEAHQAVQGLNDAWRVEVDHVKAGLGPERARVTAELVRALVAGFRY